tara:strand:+ start:163 stop:345 length:183 start_codon:yes stop_codon:yes gene_type:complete
MRTLTQATDLEIIREIDFIETQLYYIEAGKLDDKDEESLENTLTDCKQEMASRYDTYIGN